MHDKKGNPISVGDRVVVTGEVISASGNGTFCSVHVKLEGDWDGKGGTSTNYFSAKQVEVINPKTPVTLNV